MRSVAQSLVLVLTLPAAAPALGQVDGTLDTGFYGDGRYALPLVAESRLIRAVAVAPDERLVVAGRRDGNPSLFWTALDGVSPPLLCTGPAFLSGADARVEAARFDAAGRLLLAGDVEGEGFVARYLYPSCFLDSTFGIGGVFGTGFPTGIAHLAALALDAQGRILVAGSLTGTTSAWVARLGDGGGPDPSFDGDGYRVIEVAGTGVRFEAVGALPDGRVLLGGDILGEEDLSFFAVRLEATGGDDLSFSGDGRFELDIASGFFADENVHSLAVDPESGGVLLAGEADTKPVIVRLTAAGEPDPAFADEGVWTLDLGGDASFEAIERQSDGRIVAGGTILTTAGDFDFLAMRLTGEGAPDPTFGFFGGVVFGLDLGGADGDFGLAGTLQSGRFVLAGYAATATQLRGAVARLANGLVFADGFERATTAAWSRAQP